jgi:Zn-dependent protease with chaperone function
MVEPFPASEQAEKPRESDRPVTLAGPERVSFFDEQARRRRGARFLSAVCLVIASGVGVVLSTVITPLLLVIAGSALKLLVWFGVFPEMALAVIRALGDWTAHHNDNFSLLLAALDKVDRLSDLRLTIAPLAALSTICLPGLAAAALVWVGLRWVLARVEGEDLVLRLKARAPNPLDREERQLANIIEEMAIAAGLPAPRLLLVDSPLINAAAAGRSHAQATILVTRGLVESLDRRETSGIAAHLVAAIGEGDIGLSRSVLAVFQTLGFFLTILDLPFRWSASRALGGIALVALGIRRSPDAVSRVGELLEQGVNTKSADAIGRLLSWAEGRAAGTGGESAGAGEKTPSWVRPGLRKALIVPLLPLMLLSLFMKLVTFLWTALFLGPPLALLWSNRRFSADAGAVQLTRDPDGLALALRQIAGSGVPDGGEGREYVFVHAPRTAATSGTADRRGMTLSLHPTIQRRLGRLVALGATSVGAARSRWVNLEELARHPMRAALVAVLILLLAPLLVVLAAMVAYITAIVMTIAVAAGLTIASALLGR